MVQEVHPLLYFISFKNCFLDYISHKLYLTSLSNKAKPNNITR